MDLEAQRAAARWFGAERTYFLVGGSTVGNQAAILACCRDGETVVMLRGSHRSVYAGAMLAGAQPRYVPMAYDQGRDGWFLGDDTVLRDGSITADLPSKNIFAVHVTRPNYYGMATDLEPWLAFAHAHGAPLIVDEAHGSHFGLHREFPASALALGADLVIQSTHKTLGALTQASMLHVGRGAVVEMARLERALQMLQSSSPSALLTISLDLARAAVEGGGQQCFDPVLGLAHALRRDIAAMPALVVVGTDDPTKIVVDVRGLGRTGFDVADELRTTSKVGVELADLHRIVLSITVGDSEESIAGMRDGLTAVPGGVSGNLNGGLSPGATMGSQRLGIDRDAAEKSGSEGRPRFSTMAMPDVVVTPRQAEQLPTEEVAVEVAAGRIVAEFIIPYPPGVPLVVPGERLDRQVMSAAVEFIRAGCRIVGPQDPSLQRIRVLAPRPNATDATDATEALDSRV